MTSEAGTDLRAVRLCGGPCLRTWRFRRNRPTSEVLENIKSRLNGASVMSRKIEVLSREVRLTGVIDQDYVWLTDIARDRDLKLTDFLISNWQLHRNTLSVSGPLGTDQPSRF